MTNVPRVMGRIGAMVTASGMKAKGNVLIKRVSRPFFVRFEGNSFCPKMAKLDFLP